VSSTAFTFDTEDVNFTLFDQLRAHELLGQCERYAELDRDVYEATVEEAYRLAREVLAPINRNGDQQGCRLDAEGNVTTPDGYKEAWETFREGGWIAPRADEELGGSGLPATMGAMLNEVFSGACVAFVMYFGLSAAAARVIKKYVSVGRAPAIAGKLFAGQWGGTMCLTEAGAGSSVGDNRTKATPTDERGVFMIEGEKIFITGGDSNMVENICHLVLARTPGSPEGTKGLSRSIKTVSSRSSSAFTLNVSMISTPRSCRSCSKPASVGHSSGTTRVRIRPLGTLRPASFTHFSSDGKAKSPSEVSTLFFCAQELSSLFWAEEKLGTSDASLV